MATGKKRKAASKRRAPVNATAPAFNVGERVKVVHRGHWAHGYEGGIRGVSDAGELVVQLDCKAVTHLFTAAQLAAV